VFENLVVFNLLLCFTSRLVTSKIIISKTNKTTSHIYLTDLYQFLILEIDTILYER